MVTKSSKPITAEHAARLIYKTSAPHPGQVGKVRELIRAGVLKSSQRGHFTTTLSAVAEYLTDEQLRTQDARRVRTSGDTDDDSGGAKTGRGKKDSKKKPPSSTSSDRQLRRVYHDLLSDYFLAVIISGRGKNRSQQFQKTVLCLRCLLLLFLLAVGVWVVNSLVSSGRQRDPDWLPAGKVRVQQNHSAEKEVIQSWIAANRPAGELLDILPAHRRPGGVSIRARIRFQLPEKEPQYEDQVFVIQNQEVLRMETPNQEDRKLIEG